MRQRPAVPAAAFILGFLSVGTAFAAEYKSQPWQKWFQPAGSPVMEEIVSFNEFLLYIEIGIVLLVTVILLTIIWRFNDKSNPMPSKTSHNTLLEIAWTAVPIIILVIIAIPSLKLLYYSDRTQNAEMTLKVIGHQWYWSYEYPDNGGFGFDSNIVDEEDLKTGQPRLLTVDNPVYLPVKTNIRLLLSTEDVIHNWAVPSLGLKTDATAGRTNESWVRINKPGTYYGMCSELCGVNHAFMPIQVVALSREDFRAWTLKAGKEFAKADDPAGRVTIATAAGRER